jgi:hypothetical protein
MRRVMICTVPGIVWVIRSRRMKDTGEGREMCTGLLGGQSVVKHRWGDNIRIDLKEIG